MRLIFLFSFIVCPLVYGILWGMKRSHVALGSGEAIVVD